MPSIENTENVLAVIRRLPDQADSKLVDQKRPGAASASESNAKRRPPYESAKAIFQTAWVVGMNLTRAAN
ncbi:MAG: hypothetical protein MZV65_30185 [Chromatiales bacterium]|nr:hypothetical protein [Chromatiales bacterium]